MGHLSFCKGGRTYKRTDTLKFIFDFSFLHLFYCLMDISLALKPSPFYKESIHTSILKIGQKNKIVDSIHTRTNGQTDSQVDFRKF